MTMFDPFADITRLRHQMGRMLDDAQGTGAAAQEAERVWRPSVDLFEDEDGLTLRLDVPGIDRASLDVQLTGEELVVRGERKWVAPEKGACVHSERKYGPFHRSFRIGVPLQHDAVAAKYGDGVRTVRLPKAEAVKPRKVAVKTTDEG